MATTTTQTPTRDRSTDVLTLDYRLQVERLHRNRTTAIRLLGGYSASVMVFLASLLVFGTSIGATLSPQLLNQIMAQVLAGQDPQFSPAVLGDLLVSRLAAAGVLWAMAAVGVFAIGLGLAADARLHRLERQADRLRTRAVLGAESGSEDGPDHVPWTTGPGWAEGLHPWLYLACGVVGVLLATSVLLLLDRPVFLGTQVLRTDYLMLVVATGVVATGALGHWVQKRRTAEQPPAAATGEVATVPDRPRSGAGDADA